MIFRYEINVTRDAGLWESEKTNGVVIRRRVVMQKSNHTASEEAPFRGPYVILRTYDLRTLWCDSENTTMLEKQDVCVFSSEDSNQDKSHP